MTAMHDRFLLKSDYTIDVTSKGGVKLRFVERRVSVVEGAYFLRDDELWLCRSVQLREVPSNDAFISAFELFSAELRHLGSCIDFHWTICCRMVYSNLNLVQETAILVEASEFAV